MAIFKKPDQNLQFDIPEEGELFVGGGSTAQGQPFLYKRVGGQVFHTIAPQGFDTSGLNSYNPSDISAAFRGAGQFANFKTYDPNFFTNQPAGGNINIQPDPLLQQALGRAQQQGTPLAQTSIAGLPAAPAELTQPSALQQVNDLLAKGDILGVQAAQKTGQPFTKSTGEVFNPTVGGTDLKTTPTPPFEKPKETPPLDITKLNSPEAPKEDIYKLGPAETGYQKQLADLQAKITEGAQRPGFQAEQERLQDVPALQKLTRDFSSQLKLIQLEASNIQQQVQEPGAGVTTEIDRRQKAEALRLNSVKALGVYALLQMAQGNLTTAQSAADRATELKFGPIEAQIKALTANAQLAKENPDLTMEEKKRAQAILDLGEKRRELVNHAKEEERDTQQMTFEAMKNGLTDSTIINQAYNSGSRAKTALLVAPYLMGSGRYTMHTDPNTGLAVLLNTKTGETKSLGSLGGTPTPVPVVLNAQGRNDAVLQNLTPTEQATVKLLADYKMPLPAGFALKAPYFQRLLGATAQYDPTFDAIQYNARLKLKQDFNSGKAAANIRSLNTVIGHLDSLNDTVKDLQNSPIQLWNRISNYGLTQVGDPRVTNFEKASNAVVTELATVFKGMTGTDQEIKAWRETINSSQSPQQLNGGIQNLVKLIASRMDALSTQYETGIGKPKDFRLLNNKSLKILTNMGVDINKLDPISTGISAINSNQNVNNIGDIQTRVKSAGFDYQAMRNAGYSDQDIDAALKQKGL